MHYQFPEHENLGRSQHWKVRLIAGLAGALGVLIHIEGLPYGSARNMRFDGRESSGSIGFDAKGI